MAAVESRGPSYPLGGPSMTFLRIRFLLLASSLAVGCATPALAWDEPASVRGVPWGADRSAALAILQKAGEAPKCDVPRFCRTNQVMIGSTPTMVMYQFSAGDL